MQFTRARIMASVRERKRRRAGWVTVLIPIAAVLVVGSALATVSGAVPAMLHRLVGRTEQVSPTEPAPVAPSTPRSHAPAPPVAVAPPMSDSPTFEPEEAKSEPSVPAIATVPAPRDPKPSPAPPSREVGVVSGGADAPAAMPPAPVEPADLALYREAHQKHFQRGEYAGAIAAYERYLAEAPKGRFVLEASYNRALCLIRVGRTGEAAMALRPFAEGRYGTYRRQEAQRLLAALQGNDGGG